MLRKYREPRGEENLFTSLTTSFQGPNINFEEFALDVNSKLHKLKENAQIEYSEQLDFLRLKYTDYERQALYAFISGLREPYCSYIRQQNLTSIDACVNSCREYDNIQAQINYKNFLRQNMSKRNTINSTQSRFFNNNNNNFDQRRPHQNNNHNNFNRQHFSNNNNFNDFNRQNLTPTQNVFKPGSNNNNLPKPTPMTVTSRNTLRSNFQNGRSTHRQDNNHQHFSNYNTNRNYSNQQNKYPQNYNHFARQGPARPGIIIEEIHNTENNVQQEQMPFENNSAEFSENFPLHAQYQNLT